MGQPAGVRLSAVAILPVGFLVFIALAAIVGKILGRLGEKELLSNRRFELHSNGMEYEHWTRPSDSSSNAGRVVLTQTVDTPFAGVRGNWRIVATLRVTAPSARVVYSVDGETRGGWKQLDQREVVAGSSTTKLVLEPRPLSHISVPPDRLRVTVDVVTSPGTSINLHTASLRTARAGAFNSLNPPTWRELIGISLGLALLAAASLNVFLKRWRSSSPSRTALINGAFLLVSGACTLIALEIVTRTLLVFPDSMATTRVSELWWAKHWSPMNEFGIRDVSHPPASVGAKKILFVVGDSFAAGHGIARFEDTFHQHLARQLGDAWEVVVIAKPGLSTRDELDALNAYPLKPDAIIVAHVWNDVNSALATHGVQIPGKPAMIPALRPVILRSYFLDFVYWRVSGLRTPMRSYLDIVLSAYRDGAIWEAHAKDLSKFSDYAQRVDALLLVAAFPALEDIEASRLTSSRVAEHFGALGVPAIDFAEVFAGDDPRAITVNPFDSHPNEAAHARIAKELSERLTELLGENPPTQN